MWTTVLTSGGRASPDSESAGSDTGGGGEAAGPAAERYRVPESRQTPAGGESPGAEPTEHGEEPSRAGPAAH